MQQDGNNEHNPEDIAAAFFKRHKPELKSLLSTMSAKQIRRFVMCVAAYPLIDPGDKPKTDNEKRAAYVFNEMVFNKSIMQLAQEAQKVTEAMEKEKPEGENNGQV